MMKNKFSPRVLVFDFDGVIVDSNRLKRDAWFSLFGEKDLMSPELIEEALVVAKAPRQAILRYLFEKQGRDTSTIPALVAAYSNRYDEVVQEGLLAQGVAVPVRQALAALGERHTLYVNSATPEDALNHSIERLGMVPFFRGAYGMPRDKYENLKRIAEAETVQADTMLFIGDGESDWEAAKTFGCPFVGVSNEQNNWDNMSFPLLSSVTELPSLLST